MERERVGSMAGLSDVAMPARAFAGLAAIAIGIGVFLQWIDLKPLSFLLAALQNDRWGRSGWNVYQADVYHLWAGRPILLLAVACLLGALLGQRLLTMVPAGLALALAITHLITFWSDDELMAISNVGVGLYLVTLGALVAAIAGLKLSDR